jgi:hypothetical protein
LHSFARHVGIFTRVGAATNGDVGLNLFHAEHFDVANERRVLVIHLQQQFAGNTRVSHLDERRAAGGADGAHEFDGKFVRHVNHVEQSAVALFDLRGIMDEQFGQLFVTRIGHKCL